ncbi:hypothetical protein BKI52_44965 [marine bacterium AO1-C]|nr:hypothetical protein BKI52_44965 [marine bacterium AO1-C]
MDILHKRQIVVVAISTFLLFIPLIAMQLTTEVNWQPLDFLVAGILFMGAGLLGEFTLRKFNHRKYRIAALVVILLMFLLIWVELAVGIFGSPVAGS